MSTRKSGQESGLETVIDGELVEVEWVATCLCGAPVGWRQGKSHVYGIGVREGCLHWLGRGKYELRDYAVGEVTLSAEQLTANRAGREVLEQAAAAGDPVAVRVLADVVQTEGPEAARLQRLPQLRAIARDIRESLEIEAQRMAATCARSLARDGVGDAQVIEQELLDLVPLARSNGRRSRSKELSREE